ncbi:MAG: hypothetical protein D6816_18435 [Bacteroidetes bacterium]|nr:MAG: hypothetical protein D6816_18435 [Bacteroidota bacterium]
MTQQLSVLPPSTHLPVEHLAASFNNVTNSYKFYWLLAILEHIKEEQTPRVAIDTLLARMVSSVWYPTNYFHLSFGKQDRLGQIALGIKAETNIPDDAPRHEIIETATACMQQKSPLQKEIRTLGRYVPYRFLRPFFSDDLKKQKDLGLTQGTLR